MAARGGPAAFASAGMPVTKTAGCRAHDRLMRMPLRTLLLALAALGLSAGAALACSCVRFPTAAAHVAATDVIFIGEVERSAAVAGAQHQRATTFRVIETLKGEVGEQATVGHSEDICCVCGIEFKAGERVLVFAHRSEGGLATSSCSAPRFSEAQYRAALN